MIERRIKTYTTTRGTLYLTVQQLIQYLAAFVFYVGVARFITQAEVGLWSMLTASTAVFATLTLFVVLIAASEGKLINLYPNVKSNIK